VARVIKSPEGVAYEKQSLSVIAKPEKVSFKADILLYPLHLQWF